MEDMNQYPDTDRTKNSKNNNIREDIKQAKQDAKNTARDVENDFNKNAQNIKKVMRDNYGKLSSDVKDSVENTEENVKDNYENVKSNVKQTQENAKENVKNKAKSTFENMKENINENYQNAKEKIKDSYNQFKDSYQSKANNTTQSMKEGAQNIKEGAQNMKQDMEEKVEGAKEEMKDKYYKTKNKAQDKADEKTKEAKSKMENMKEESKSKMENMKEKTKETYQNIKNEITGKFDMNEMLNQARVNLENLLKMEDSKDILKDAKAIIFLSIMKSGLGISGVMGSGIMITRTGQNNQEWSGPVAVGLTGVSIGLNAGFEKADNIMIIRDEDTLKQLSMQRELQLSGDIAYVMGKGGYDSSVPLSRKEHEHTPVIAYSMTKGAYISLSLKGEMLKIRNDWHEEFYKQKVNTDDIISRKIKAPQNNNYNSVIKLLNDFYFSIDKNKTSTTSKKTK